jgi:hypothetical protein
MPDSSTDDGETASQEVARAIWQTVLLGRDEYKARGIIGKATRRRLAEKILKLTSAPPADSHRIAFARAP